MSELWNYDFVRNAFCGGLLAALACGMVGSFIVARKMVFLAGGISHAAFGGVGLGYWLQFNPLVGGALFAVASAMGIALTSRIEKRREDTSIGVFWSVGMSLGILFLGLSKGYTPDVSTYLFGNILAITPSDLWIMLALDLGILGVTFVFFKEFTAIVYDEEFAAARGLPVGLLYLLLLVMVSLAIVVLMKMVGMILVLALLALPAAAAQLFSANIRQMIFKSTVIGAVTIGLGLWAAFSWDMPASPCIVLLATAVYFAGLFVKRSGVLRLGRG